MRRLEQGLLVGLIDGTRGGVDGAGGVAGDEFDAGIDGPRAALSRIDSDRSKYRTYTAT